MEHDRLTHQRRLKIATFLGGLAGLAGQMLLLRELLVVFTGNELTIGVMLANWLLLEAFGCRVLGKRAERIRRLDLTVAIMNGLLPCALMGMVYASRLIRPALGYTAGQHIGIMPAIITSFFVLLPVSTIHGALFTFSSKLYSTRAHHAGSAGALSTIYIWETLGTLAGGALWTFLFSFRFNAFITTGIILLLHATAAMLVLWPDAATRTAHTKPHVPFRLSVVLSCCALAMLTTPTLYHHLHTQSLKQQWMPQPVAHYQNSHFGNATVVGRDGHYSIFLDGMPYMTIPVPPDIAFIEAFVHLPMLIHPQPRNVLVLSGGAGGMLYEILQHETVKQVTYAELDPMVLKLFEQMETPETQRELADPRVRIHNRDGRLLLQRTASHYDIIWIGITALNDLQSNRFFTREFFSLAASRLHEDGLLVFMLPGSLTFTSAEIKGLNALVYHTVKHAFPHTRVFPGDGHNLFVASASDAVMSFSLDTFMDTVADRDLNVAMTPPRHLVQKLHPGWGEWFTDFIRDASDDINRDFHPRGLLYGLSHWNLSTAPAFSRIFGHAMNVRWQHVFPVLACLLVVLHLLRRSCRRIREMDVPLCIATSGFAGMSFDLILIFAFQALYGFVIGWMGFLVSVFMAGAAAGAMLLSRESMKKHYSLKLLLKLDGVIVGFALLLPFLLMLLNVIFPHMGSGMLAAFLVISFCSGFVISMQFPVAAGIQMTNPARRFSDTAGILYAADLLGGWLAGLVIAVLILPAYGLIGVGIWVAALKIFSISALAGQAQIR